MFLTDIARDSSIFLLVFIALTSYVRWYVYKKYTLLMKLSNVNDAIGKKKIKVGVLTNELPPIIYGGVSTWVLWIC